MRSIPAAVCSSNREVACKNMFSSRSTFDAERLFSSCCENTFDWCFWSAAVHVHRHLLSFSRTEKARWILAPQQLTSYVFNRFKSNLKMWGLIACHVTKGGKNDLFALTLEWRLQVFIFRFVKTAIKSQYNWRTAISFLIISHLWTFLILHVHTLHDAITGSFDSPCFS